MSAAANYHISRVVVALTVPGVCYCFSRMIPAGIAGNTSETKRWFAISAAIIILGVISFIIMTYAKTKLENPITSEAEILSAAVTDISRQRTAAPAKLSAPSTAPQAPGNQAESTETKAAGE